MRKNRHICVCDWTTWLCTWNTVNQLYQLKQKEKKKLVFVRDSPSIFKKLACGKRFSDLSASWHQQWGIQKWMGWVGATLGGGPGRWICAWGRWRQAFEASETRTSRLDCGALGLDISCKCFLFGLFWRLVVGAAFWKDSSLCGPWTLTLPKAELQQAQSPASAPLLPSGNQGWGLFT